jgi:hypothetical protein
VVGTIGTGNHQIGLSFLYIETMEGDRAVDSLLFCLNIHFILDSTDSQSSGLNYLRCPPIHQDYLQNHTSTDNLPAIHRMRWNSSDA